MLKHLYKLIFIAIFMCVSFRVLAVPKLNIKVGYNGSKKAQEVIFTIPKWATGNDKSPTSSFQMNFEMKTKAILASFHFDRECDVVGHLDHDDINVYTFFVM